MARKKDEFPAGRTDEITQDELVELFHINGLIDKRDETVSLVDEIREAILDSGKLSLHAWQDLRARLREIEELIPHIDLIIRLKQKQKRH